MVNSVSLCPFILRYSDSPSPLLSNIMIGVMSDGVRERNEEEMSYGYENQSSLTRVRPFIITRGEEKIGEGEEEEEEEMETD